ncbi:MAG: PAS domain S-box protein [Candidatus Aegiribacteria sp.]|nr:PAS domain S-box protein [Candidatus Aegiribacteria sp.]
MHKQRKASTFIFQGIATRLCVVFLILSIVPILIMAYYNLSNSQEEIIEVISENLLELSRGAAHSIEQLLTENQRNSATLAGDPIVVKFLSASEEERSTLAPSIYRVLQNFADTHPDYDAPGLLDINGIVVVSLDDILIGRDRSFRDYFQVSIQGEPYVSSILVGRATGRPGVFLTHPVITDNGDIVGIDIIWLKASVVYAVISRMSVGMDGTAFVVDQDGVIIVHPDSTLLYHSLVELTPEASETISETIRFGTAEDSDTPLIPLSLGMTDLASAITSGNDSGICQYHSPFDDCDHVAAYARLGSFPWTVVVDLPETRFLAPFQRLRSVSWIATGILAAIVMIVSLLLARGVTRPIRKLVTTASTIERNEPFDPLDLKDVTSGRDEIAHLGRIFSDMVLSLRRESSKAENHTEHLNLILRAIRNVNQLITKEKDRDRLIQRTCKNLVETRGYFSAWIILLDESGKPFSSAEAGMEDRFQPLLERLKAGGIPECCRRAMEIPEVIVTFVPDSSCGDCPLSDMYENRASATTRLEWEDKVYGLLTVLVPVEYAENIEEVGLFREVAEDIGFALHGMELDEARKLGEEQLRDSERKYRLLADNTIDCIWQTDPDFRFTYVNPAIFQMLGFTQEEWTGSLLSDHCLPEDMEYMTGFAMAELKKGSESIGLTFETNLLHKNGEKVPVEITGKVLRDNNGKTVGFQGTTRDITIRKDAENALRRKTEEVNLLLRVGSKLGTTLDLVEVCGHLHSSLSEIMDCDGLFLSAYSSEDKLIRCLAAWGEEKWMDVSELPPIPLEEEGLGTQSIAIRTGQSVNLDDYQAYMKTAETSYSVDQDGRIADEGEEPADGNITRSALIVPLKFKGEVVGVVQVLSYRLNAYTEYNLEFLEAITPHVAATVVNLTLFQQIEKEYDERKQLEEQLRQSQKMEAIGMLAGGIAHDFNNILQAIFGYTDLAEARLSEGDPVLEDLMEIDTSARRAADLTQQLLAFGRRQVLVPKDINLNDLIGNLLKMLRRVIGEDIELKFNQGHRLGTVHADPVQIEQVIMNLCVNARDAMPNCGNLTIETENVLITEDYCSTHPSTQQGRYVLLAITDSGCGMNEETRNRIFEPFFTTKTVGKGSGLGLSTAHGIVNQHDGFINVYSEEGKGTAFKIYLPLVERPAEYISASIKGSVTGGTETILVAEDDEVLRYLARRILEKAGYTVLLAEDGLEAVGVLEQQSDKISLALLDIVMPGMSGKEVYDRMREISPITRTLFTSGYSSNTVHTRFVLDEGMHLISKPYDPDTLLHKVRAVLDE